MFKAQRNGKSPSSGEKIDFKFSNFQALQVPKVWDKLLVSIICIETGKTIARSNKALVRNGSCQWTETLSESIWIQHHNSSKELEEHLFKFVVSMGSTRSGILGEATVNMARYYTSSRSSSQVSLPLKKCNYGTILQVKIQCLTPRTKLRYMFVDEDYDHAGSRSNDLSASLNPKSKPPSCQDLAPTSLLEQMKIMETSYKQSYSKQNNASVEYSQEREKVYQNSHMNGIKHNIDANSKNNFPQSSCPVKENVSVSKSNNSSLESRITQDDEEQEYNGSSTPGPPSSSSVMNIGSSKNLLEAAEETIEKLRDEARTWERKSQKLTIGLEILKEKYSDQSKVLAESQMEISSAMAERDDIKKEADHIKMLLEESIVKHKASGESKSRYNSKGQSQVLKELENDLKAHKESNNDLAQQLKKSQESNIELVCILQELEETTETQRKEIEELQVVNSKLTELEKTFNSNLVETRSLQLKLQQMEESEKTLQANTQVLEQALENERISNSQTQSDLEKEYETTLSAKEEYIKNLESKLSETKEIEKDQMREIERLQMKVSEVENDCNELTNENLELVCELKETKKAVQERNKTIEENTKLLEDCSLKIQELEKRKGEQEARISDLEKEKEELQNESNITSICLDNLRNDQMVLSSSLDSQISANKLLEEKAMKLEKVKCEMELCLFEMEEENIKLVERVSELENQITQVKDEHEMTRLELEKFESEKSDLQTVVNNLQDVEKSLLDAQEECEYVKAEKQKLQESAENLIEECNTLQKSYEDMTKGNAELYDQYSCLVIELTSETEKNQKEVEHLKNEISRLDEQKSKLTSEKINLESSLKDHSRTEMVENKILAVREEYEHKIQDLTTELAAFKQNHKKLMADHEKKSKLLAGYRIREERKGTMQNNLELKLTVSEHEHKELTEEAANLKDEVLDYKQKLEKLKNEKSNLEASLHSVSNSFEELKAEKMSFFNKMSEFEDCKNQKDALEEKLSRLEGDLTAKNESRLQNADMKNEISRIKSANLQHRLKIQQLEGEKKECLKKIEDLQLPSAKSKTGVHEARTHEDTDYAAKIKMLEAELDEALNANHKYRVQLQKLKSKGRNSLSSGKSKVEGEVVTKELFEKTKSSLEMELKDLRDRYLEMSLKYAQVEAEKGDLVMQLKTNGAKKRS